MHCALQMLAKAEHKEETLRTSNEASTDSIHSLPLPSSHKGIIHILFICIIVVEVQLTNSGSHLFGVSSYISLDKHILPYK